MKYRNYDIYFEPPSIPDRRFDWHYCHVDYDGPGDSRSGMSGSEADCKAAIDSICEEE